MSIDIKSREARNLQEYVDFLASKEAVDGDACLAKRGAGRYRTGIPATLRTIGENRLGQPFTADLRDISAGGICFRSPFRLGVDQMIRVELEADDLTWTGKGRVVHCTESLGGFYVGLHIMQLRDPRTAAGADTHLASDLRGHAELQIAIKQMFRMAAQHRRAVLSMGLLGTTVGKRLNDLVRGLAPTPKGKWPQCRRSRKRFVLKNGIRLISIASDGYAVTPAIGLDVSTNGIGLALPPHDVTDKKGFIVSALDQWQAGTPVVFGIGDADDPIWVPGRIVRAAPAENGHVIVGAQIEPKVALLDSLEMAG
jgi:hypothetical protein